jgi:hypothetical protein
MKTVAVTFFLIRKNEREGQNMRAASCTLFIDFTAAAVAAGAVVTLSLSLCYDGAPECMAAMNEHSQLLCIWISG